jgi:hypothetical protein
LFRFSSSSITVFNRLFSDTRKLASSIRAIRRSSVWLGKFIRNFFFPILALFIRVICRTKRSNDVTTQPQIFGPASYRTRNYRKRSVGRSGISPFTESQIRKLLPTVTRF